MYTANWIFNVSEAVQNATEAEQTEGAFLCGCGVWRGVKGEDGDSTGVAEGRDICSGVGEADVLGPCEVTAEQLPWGWSRNTSSHFHPEAISWLPQTSCLRGNGHISELTVCEMTERQPPGLSFKMGSFPSFSSFSGEGLDVSVGSLQKPTLALSTYQCCTSAGVKVSWEKLDFWHLLKWESGRGWVLLCLGKFVLWTGEALVTQCEGNVLVIGSGVQGGQGWSQNVFGLCSLEVGWSVGSRLKWQTSLLGKLGLGEVLPPWYVSGDASEVTQDIQFPIKAVPRISSVHFPEWREAGYTRNSSSDVNLLKPCSFNPYHQEGTERHISAFEASLSGAQRPKSTWLPDTVSRKMVKLLLSWDGSKR